MIPSAAIKSIPFFSIVIPVFNRAHSLAVALDSVLEQDWQSYEVIVVDDGSTDGIDAVIHQYTPLGVAFLRNQMNSGVGHTRNKGVRAARGEWVTFLDSDNRLRPNGLSILRSTITRCDKKVAVVYGKSELIGVRPRSPGPSGETPTRWGYKEYLQAQHVDEALPVTRRNVLLDFPFEESLGIKRECGVLVWYAIARAGYEFVWTREVVQRYEISPDSLSGKQFLAAHPKEMVICNQKILEGFGDDLRRNNRPKLVTLHQKTAFYCIMADRRPCALRHAHLAWKLDPINLRTYALFVLCGLGSRAARALYRIAV